MLAGQESNQSLVMDPTPIPQYAILIVLVFRFLFLKRIPNPTALSVTLTYDSEDNQA